MTAKQSKRLNVRLSEVEHEIVATRAAAADLGISEYVRRCVLLDRDGPTIVTDVATLKQLYVSIRKSGGLLNQACRELNTHHRPDQLDQELHVAFQAVKYASDSVSSFIQAARESI